MRWGPKEALGGAPGTGGVHGAACRQAPRGVPSTAKGTGENLWGRDWTEESGLNLVDSWVTVNLIYDS